MQKKFSEHLQKILLENSLLLSRNPKKTKRFHSNMTSMTMFGPNKNLFYQQHSIGLTKYCVKSLSKYRYKSV